MESTLQILVVEDEKFMRQLVVRILLDLGFKRIIEAEDGKEGLKALMAGKSGIGLVLLDIEMPNVGGLDFLRLVRTSPASPNKDVPVVMLTGHSDAESLKEAAKFGIHGFLAKPVSKANLEKQVKRVFGGASPIDPSKIVGI